jgi:hypothetical protein
MSISGPHAPASVPAEMRRSSANAPQRASARRWKMAMSTAVRKGRYLFKLQPTAAVAPANLPHRNARGERLEPWACTLIDDLPPGVRRHADRWGEGTANTPPIQTL